MRVYLHRKIQSFTWSMISVTVTDSKEVWQGG
nr:MAG TPA: hypothetical protein [Caudoviricetes sp.]